MTACIFLLTCSELCILLKVLIFCGAGFALGVGVLASPLFSVDFRQAIGKVGR